MSYLISSHHKSRFNCYYLPFPQLSIRSRREARYNYLKYNDTFDITFSKKYQIKNPFPVRLISNVLPFIVIHVNHIKYQLRDFGG